MSQEEVEGPSRNPMEAALQQVLDRLAQMDARMHRMETSINAPGGRARAEGATGVRFGVPETPVFGESFVRSNPMREQRHVLFPDTPVPEHRNRGGGQEGHETVHPTPAGRERGEHDFRDVKLNIPTFAGKRDPEAYWEWERTTDLSFEFRGFPEWKKLSLVLQSLRGYALTWYDDLSRKRLKYGGAPIESWIQLRSEMRKRFVPLQYERDVYQKLQFLVQGTKTVEEYFEELQTLMLRVSLEEEEELLMARFLRGLNREIVNVVELQTYSSLEELLEKSIKIEQQMKRGRTNRSQPSQPGKTQMPIGR